MTTSGDRAYYRLAFKIVADFSGMIAIPAVLAALLGKWMDTRYQTSPRYMILFLVIAFMITAYIIAKKSEHYRKQYESINTDSQKHV